MTRQFGIRTSGTEEELENTIKELIARFPNVWNFYEMGTASGLTLKAVTEIVKESGHKSWFVFGTDLPDGYSFNKEEFKRNLPEAIIIENPEENWNIPVNNTALFLGDARKFMKLAPDEQAHCIFIDADHSKMAVIEDFLTVEPKVTKGGYVIFHDAGELERGTDPQPNGEGINVRGALEDLGLLENKRDGWRFVREIIGDRAQGGWGNNCVVIEKL